MVPAQNRPVGSTLPSFMRVAGSFASTGASSVNTPVSAPTATNPSGVAPSRPPEARSTTTASGRATSRARSRPSSEVGVELPARDFHPPHDATLGIPGRALT